MTFAGNLGATGVFFAGNFGAGAGNFGADAGNFGAGVCWRRVKYATPGDGSA